MKSFTRVAFVSAALVATGIALAPANAVYVDMSNCTKMAHQVRDALKSAPSGTDTSAARDQMYRGQDLCQKGYYRQGVAAYERALSLLSKH